MNKLVLLLFLIPFINSFSQEIFLSKNTIRINSPAYVDSVTITNKGNKVLVIKSIKYRNTKYAYNIDPQGRQTMWKLLEEYGRQNDEIKILPHRSVTIRIKVASTLKKEPNVKYDKVDTIFLYNNSTNSPVVSIKVVNMLGETRRSRK